MTDLEKLEALLTEFGVEFETSRNEDGSAAVKCAEGMKKVVGYCSFFTEFMFNQDGSFDCMGAWE